LPYSIQWTLGTQHQLRKDYTVEVRYVGTRGVHLLVQNQMLRFAPVQEDRSLQTYLSAPSQATLNSLRYFLAGNTDTGFYLGCAGGSSPRAQRNPILGPLGFFSAITWWPPIGNSVYHGLAAQVTRRFTRGLQFVGAYTWSHNIDDSTATHFSTFLTPRREQDFLNLGRDKASSALDRRHRLTFSWNYEPQWFSGASTWAMKNLAGNWRFVGTY